LATNVRENQRGNQEWTSRRNWQPRIDKPEKLATKNGQAGETGNQEWTSRRNWQSRMDKPEKLAIFGYRRHRTKTNKTMNKYTVN
jgi:hypothetical protein